MCSAQFGNFLPKISQGEKDKGTHRFRKEQKWRSFFIVIYLFTDIYTIYLYHCYFRTAFAIRGEQTTSWQTSKKALLIDKSSLLFHLINSSVSRRSLIVWEKMNFYTHWFFIAGKYREELCFVLYECPAFSIPGEINPDTWTLIKSLYLPLLRHSFKDKMVVCSPRFRRLTFPLILKTNLSALLWAFSRILMSFFKTTIPCLGAIFQTRSNKCIISNSFALCISII